MAHAVQYTGLDAAPTLLYWPAGQAVHALTPGEWYVPAGHVVQNWDELAPGAYVYVPTAHAVHTTGLVAAVSLLYSPKPHSVHAEAPAAGA